VVIAQSPSNPAQTVCKRIRGLEGDVLRTSKRHRYDKGKIITVPSGHVWLEGDNQFNSSDSRHYGPVPYSILKGRVFLRIWPLFDIGWVKSTKVR
jgi:inner membrane protease subunit 1